MSKRIISRGSKIFMSVLLVTGIGCYIASGVVLYNSNYKLSNYYDNIQDLVHMDEWGFDSNNISLTQGIEVKSETKSIDINTTSAKIEIVNSNEDNIRIELYGNERREHNGNVSIQANTMEDTNKTIKIGIINENLLRNATLTIYIPSKYNNNITISSVSGHMEISNIKGKSLSVKNTSGHVNINSSIYENAIIQTISGKIEAQNSKFVTSKITSTSGPIDVNGEFGEAKVGSTSGKIDISTNKLGKLTDIDTSSGEVNVSLNAATNYTVNYSTVSGVMRCNNERYKDNGNSNKIAYTQGNGENIINVKTTSGNIDIR